LNNHFKRSKLLTQTSTSVVVGESKTMEQEKRIRREIANSNERRRMQSINAGFQALRTLLPHHEGEKLSKAAILQQTAEYIYSLEQEKTRLLSQNCQLKRLLGQTQHMVEADETDSAPAPKRRLIDTGQKFILEDDAEELADTQNKLERERRTRMALEERVRLLENQLYQGRPKHIVQRYSTEDRVPGIDSTVNLEAQIDHTGQTILTPAAKKQVGVDTIVLGDKLPSIIQCAIGKNDGTRVEVEQIPRLSDMPDNTAAVEIASVQDPETGNTRQYIVTQVDNTSKQNLETIVEAIRHLEGDHLFSEESGPHQVVKEEVVESCMMDDGSVGTVVEMTLPSQMTLPSLSSNLGVITSLPQVPVTSLGQISLPQVPISSLPQIVQSLPPMSANLPTVPVSFQATASVSMPQLPVSVSSLAASLVSSLQQPVVTSLPQNMREVTSLPQNMREVPSLPQSMLPQVPVTSLSPVTSLPQVPVSLSQAPVTASQPVLPGMQMEIASIGPPQTSPVNLELQSGGHVTPTSELSNSPPQSSPVNLAHPSVQPDRHLDVQ